MDLSLPRLGFRPVYSVPDHGSYETSEKEKDDRDDSLSSASMKEPWRDESLPRRFFGSASFDRSFV